MRPLQAILPEYPQLAVREVVRLGNHGGFSGARLFLLHCVQGDYALKIFPAERDASEIARIHSFMIHASREGLPFVPQLIEHRGGDCLLHLRDHFAEVSTWQTGTADFRANPTRVRLQAACEALARLHHVWQPLAHRHGPCPGVMRRLQSLQAWNQRERSGWPRSRSHPLTAWIEPARQLILRWQASAIESLTRWLAIDLPLHPCLCDLWHDHVLFTGNEVTGLIDYGSVKIDHAAVDLARLLGSFLGDDPAGHEAGLDAYHRVRPLNLIERELVSLLDRTGAMAALCNWLRWIEEGKRWENLNEVAARLNQLVRRVERWTTLLESNAIGPCLDRTAANWV